MSLYGRPTTPTPGRAGGNPRRRNGRAGRDGSLGAVSLDADSVRHVARLARLRLTADEVDLMAAELSGVLAHVETIGRLDLAGVEATTHAVPLTDVLRADAPRPSFTPEEALAQAPDPARGGFRVPRIGGAASAAEDR